jgi:arsenate reductase
MMAIMIQIFGTPKCKTTRAAQRFFAERRIQVQFVDVREKGLSAGELSSVARAVGGLHALYDASKDSTVRYAVPSETQLTKLLLEDPKLLRTPIVREGPRAAVGAAEAFWKELAETARS